MIDNVSKRYFSIASATTFTQPYFEAKYLDNLGETYKDSRKGIHHLIRFVGQKK